MPPGTLEQVVFRMDLLARLEAAGKVVLNPARAVEAAVDKYLVGAKLAAAELLTPRTTICQTVDDALRAFTELGGDIVLKPLFVPKDEELPACKTKQLAKGPGLIAQLGGVLYVQEFIPHDGYDLRVLVVGPRMWAMRRHNPLDFRTNVSRGAWQSPSR